MSVAKNSKPKTPLGLPPIFFPIYYTLVLCITGFAISAVEPMKALLRMAGVASHLPPDEMESKLLQITNAGYSLSIIGAIFAGAFCDFCGPKITAMSGQALFGAGYALLFFVPIDATFAHYLGSCSLGMAYSLIFNSHTSVAALYPRYATIILAILGSGPDVSLVVPTGLGVAAAKFGGIVPVIATYICVIGVIFVLEAFLVPYSFFQPSLPDEPELSQYVTDDPESSPPPTAAPWRSNGFASLSLKNQLLTPHFWIFSFFTACNMFRKTHYTQLVGKCMGDVGTLSGTDPSKVDFYVDMFKKSLPFAVFPALAMGVLTNAFGIVAGLTIENVWGVLLFICCSIPIMQVQSGSIILYNLMSSYVFGIVFAFLATYYGLNTLSTLQGIQLSIAGGISFLVPLWDAYFVSRFPTILTANRVILAVSLAMFVVPLFIYLNPPGVSQDEEFPLLNATETCDDRRQTTAYLGFANQFDRASMQVIKGSIDSKGSGHRHRKR